MMPISEIERESPAPFHLCLEEIPGLPEETSIFLKEAERLQTCPYFWTQHKICVESHPNTRKLGFLVLFLLTLVETGWNNGSLNLKVVGQFKAKLWDFVGRVKTEHLNAERETPKL